MEAWQASYLAGFFDGDGSIHFQLVRQKEYKFGFYIRTTADNFVRVAREVDAFSTLNYSKSKRIFAVDVENHLRSKGLLAPVTTPSELNGGMGSSPQGKLWIP